MAIMLTLGTLACAAPAGLSLWPTVTPTITPTATVTPTATPTPTPVPVVHLEAAERSMFYGDWDTALTEFQSALASAGDALTQGQARLGIGETLLRAGRLSEAVQALGEFLDLHAGHPDQAEAFVGARPVKEGLGQSDLAAEDYDHYLALHPGRIESYVYERIGDALRRAGRPTEALVRYQAALNAPRLGSTLTLEVKIGLAYQESGDYSSAFQQFDRLFQSTTDTATLATMNYLAGLALESLGDFEGAHARYLDSVNNYPDQYDAYSGLVRLVNAGVPVDDFQRGLIDYLAGAYEPAWPAFDRVLGTAPSGTAFYYRGLTRRALGDVYGAIEDFRSATGYPEDPHAPQAWLEMARTMWLNLDLYAEAIQTYQDFVRAYPASPLCGEALFTAGRLAERSGDLTAAATLWLRLPAEYPTSEMAHQGAFQAGVALYRLSDWEASRQAFQTADAHAADPGEHAASMLWMGKTRQAQADVAGAHADWLVAAAADPTGYYSVRAEDLLAGRPPFTAEVAFDFEHDEESERLAAETWLRATFPVTGPDPLTELSPALASDSRLLRGLEFWELGLGAEAKAEFESLRVQYEDDAESTYRLMHAFLDLDLYQPAIFAARQILRLAGMDDAATMSAPVYFNRIRFGSYFGDLILPEAAQYGLDGLLLLSVVRQESLFEGFATSYAEARGLMQVIPDTGQYIADALGWPAGYTSADLYRPVVSVRFGTYYLASQRDAFNGDLYAALAAYNAGPGNAAVWEGLAPDDPDLFLEVIRIDQSHLYIRRIYEIYAFYRALYATP